MKIIYYLFGRGLDVNNSDCDNDGLKDGVEIKTGVWSDTVVSGGVCYFTSPLSNDSDGDGCFDKYDPVPLDYDMDADGYINCLDIINPKSSYYVSRLVFAVNHDPNLKRDGSGNLISDSDMDNDGTPDSSDTDDDNDGMTDQYEIDYGVANKGWQNPYIFNQRFAILICGWSSESGKNWPGIWNDMKKMYKVLRDKYGYSDENIYLHHSNKRAGWHDGSIVADGPADWWIDDDNRSLWGDGISQTFDKIRLKMSINDFLFLKVISHGFIEPYPSTEKKGQGGFEGYNVETGTQTDIWYGRVGGSTGQVIDVAIDNLVYARVVIVITACGAGTAIKGTDNEPEANLKGDNRIIVTSCDKNEPTVATFYTHDHVYFLWNERWWPYESEGFVYKYANSGSISVYTAFQSGVNGSPSQSNPQIWEGDVDSSYTYL